MQRDEPAQERAACGKDQLAAARGLLEAEASQRPSDVMITRRRMLAASAAIAAIAAAKSATAGTPTGRTRGRNGTMGITRNGSQPSSKGPAEYFTGSVRVDPLFQTP